jgi:hypothetical protein
VFPAEWKLAAYTFVTVKTGPSAFSRIVPCCAINTVRACMYVCIQLGFVRTFPSLSYSNRILKLALQFNILPAWLTRVDRFRLPNPVYLHGVWVTGLLFQCIGSIV